MGKKNKTGLGRALIKDRFGGARSKKLNQNSMLHTTEVQDGYDWGRLNLQSVTEESSFQEFLSTAELAGTEFQAEKLNIKFVNPRVNVGLLTKNEIKKAKEDHDKFREIIKIPRRPKWTPETTTEQLQQNERESFLEWRRSLAMLQEDEGLLLTPYEKNLEFWRQLWRVVERSDVVVQIVDARNPLLFRCEDLEKYVREVSEDKMNMILVNKADFLSEEQRQYWADYFKSISVNVAFFSALETPDETIEEEDEEGCEESSESEDDEELDKKNQSEDEKLTKKINSDDDKLNKKSESEDDKLNKKGLSEIDKLMENKEKTVDEIKASFSKLEQAVESTALKLEKLSEEIQKRIEDVDLEKDFVNTSQLLSRENLIELFRTVHKGKKVTEGITTIGLVGYPNVGKSSTINALMTEKKVSVSATPGKTKHFQTLFLDKDILLCDCPGLVMPSFVLTKAEMVINGILPIDQMRDHVPPVNLVANLIPKHVFEDMYGIMLPQPLEGEDENRPPTSEELLNAYAFNRGFMTANGQPDNPRSARYILKDYMNGKLLYAHAPPNVEQNVYHTWPEKQRKVSQNHVQTPREIRAIKGVKMTTQDLDKIFFNKSQQGVHVKGRPIGIPNVTAQDGSTMMAKPWKKINKHENKKKREKLRRVYSHLDQH